MSTGSVIEAEPAAEGEPAAEAEPVVEGEPVSWAALASIGAVVVSASFPSEVPAWARAGLVAGAAPAIAVFTAVPAAPMVVPGVASPEAVVPSVASVSPLPAASASALSRQRRQ